jgi:hypothetical protein
MTGIKIAEADLHPHFRARMHQRGITPAEVEDTINQGWKADDAKPGTLGKTKVYDYNREWEGDSYSRKEVTVYYKLIGGQLMLLTVKARYGQSFPER